MPKRRKYKPLKNILSIDAALLQASSLLDIAAQQAVAEGDMRAMRKAAHSWVEVSAVMHQLSQVEEQEEVEQHEVVSRIGFAPPPEITDEEVDEWEEEPEEDLSGTKFQIGFRGND